MTIDIVTTPGTLKRTAPTGDQANWSRVVELFPAGHVGFQVNGAAIRQGQLVQGGFGLGRGVGKGFGTMAPGQAWNVWPVLGRLEMLEPVEETPPVDKTSSPSS